MVLESNWYVEEHLDSHAQAMIEVREDVNHRHCTTAFFKLFVRYAKAEFLWYVKGGIISDYL